MPSPRKLSRFEQDDVADREGRGDEQRGRDVREHVPRHDPERPRPDRHPGPDVVALAHAQGGAAHQPRDARPAEQGHDHDDARDARRLRCGPPRREPRLREVHRREHDEEGEERGRGHPVREPHEGRVDPTPEVARGQPDEGSEEGGGERAREPHRERHPPPVEESKAGVAAELVGPEPMGGGRTLEAGEEVHPGGIEAAHRFEDGGGGAKDHDPGEDGPGRAPAAPAGPGPRRSGPHR